MESGAGDAFTRALYRKEFAHGADIEAVETLREAASAAGLDADDLPVAIQRPEVKASLRLATEQAWELGVHGVPTVRVADAVFYGDDQLEVAAAHAQSITRP